jgi:hypothetical protein
MVGWTAFYSPSEEGAHRLFPYSYETKVQRDESFTESLDSPGDMGSCHCVVTHLVIPPRALAYLMWYASSIASNATCQAWRAHVMLIFDQAILS